jgi:serine/threonine-protein kinase
MPTTDRRSGRGKRDAPPRARRAGRSEADTLVDGDWPVAPELAQPLFEPAPERRDEPDEVVIDRAGRLPGATALVIAALLLILALGGGLVWALTRHNGPSGAGTARAGAAHSGLPRLVGIDLAAATALLEQTGFKVRVERVESNGPKGVVLRQTPVAGSRSAPGGIVTLTVSDGAGQTRVPRVLGLSLDEATTALRAARLRVETTTRASSQPAGTVVGQTPGSAMKVDRGSTVRLEVARRAAVAAPASAPKAVKVIMPPLVGGSIAQARNRLSDLGLHASVERAPSSQPTGTVLGQTPVAGAQMRRGMTVELRVSSGPATIDVPDVTGQGESSARQQLTSAGFQVQTLDRSVTDPAQDGVVVDQSPAGGTAEYRGDVVTITVGRVSG